MVINSAQNISEVLRIILDMDKNAVVTADIQTIEITADEDKMIASQVRRIKNLGFDRYEGRFQTNVDSTDF